MIMIRINNKVAIPEKELKFTASGSPGPGGQNVNRVNTKITLFFNIDRSPSLTQLEKMIIKGRLRRRINNKGVLRVVCHSSRSQAANKEEAVRKFVNMLDQALTPVVNRIRGTAPPSSRRRRLADKKARSILKRNRSGSSVWNEN